MATHPALETTEHPKEINPARLARLDDPLRQPAKRAAKEQEAKPSREAPRGASSDENEAPRQQAKPSPGARARQKCLSGDADPHATQTQPIAIGERGGPRDRGLSWHGGASSPLACPRAPFGGFS